MLVDVKLGAKDPSLEMILSSIGQGGTPEKIEDGVYLTKSYSFDNQTLSNIESYFDFDSLSPHGVCDDLQQTKELYKKWLDDPDLKFCIALTQVVKADQPRIGGWRWHKWGPYIGTKEPKQQYIFDEDDSIESVYVYHIYQVLD